MNNQPKKTQEIANARAARMARSYDPAAGKSMTSR
jgi:hypothetical protein